MINLILDINKTVATEIQGNLFYFISDSFNNRIVQLNEEGLL